MERIKAMLIGFATSLKQRSLKTRRRRMNIFCILVHVPDRNTKNRWFVASAPRIFRLFTNLSSGLLVNLSRPRCISNYRERGKFRFCKLFETHTWCTCYTNFIRPAFLKFSWLPLRPRFPRAFAYLDFFTSTIFSLPRDIFFTKKYIYIFFFSTVLRNVYIKSVNRFEYIRPKSTFE